MQCVSHKNIISSENAETAAPRPFTVLMPVFNQCGFVRRAVSSLFSQTYAHWELIIINDGSTDALNEFIADYLTDSRIKYIENPENYGLGYALNRGLDAASYDLIAYLPADDFFYENHLQTLADALAKPEVALAFTGIRFDDSKDSGFLDYKTCKGAIPGYCTQFVQVAHRKTADRWTDREECVSEDLFYLFWRKLTGRGAFAPCQTVTCEWCCHPNQRHKICGERYGGGLNKYRAYYGVKQPIRFRSGKYKIFDEVGNYAPYRNHVVSYSEGLKMLSRIFIALTTMLLGAVSVSTYAARLCKDPETLPAFVGGLLDGMPKYLAKNFKYPKEAWKSGKCGTGAVVDVIITKKGTVSEVRCYDIKHPALEKELIRVMKETRWYPATKRGEPVDVRMTLLLSLRPEFFEGEPIPFGFEYIVKDADKNIGFLKECQTLPVDNELKHVETAVAEAADVFMDIPRYPIAFATFKSALGDGYKAVETMDSCWSRYHWVPNPEYGRLGFMGIKGFVNGYNGRIEIWVALMRAMQHQRNGSERTDSAYRDAIDLIDERIVDTDLREIPSPQEIAYSERRMARMQRDMVNEFVRGNMLSHGTSGWDKITREYSLSEISGALGYWSRKGYINNAQVGQLYQLIQDEFQATKDGKYAKKGVHMKLFGAKAFAIWMHEGNEGLSRFLAQIREGGATKKLLRHMAKLEKNLAGNAALLSDRRAVLECLTTIAPVHGTPEAEVKAFYDRRKAVAKVFPLKWLMKE